MGVLVTYGAHREKKTSTKKINMWVTMRPNTGLIGANVLADRYRLEDGDPYLRVHYNGRKEWHQILEFKNSYIILLAVDPEFAKAHLGDYILLNAAEKGV